MFPNSLAIRYPVCKPCGENVDNLFPSTSVKKDDSSAPTPAPSTAAPSTVPSTPAAAAPATLPSTAPATASAIAGSRGNIVANPSRAVTPIIPTISKALNEASTMAPDNVKNLMMGFHPDGPGKTTVIGFPVDGSNGTSVYTKGLISGAL